MIIDNTIYLFGFRALPIISSIFFKKSKSNINLNFEINTNKFKKIVCKGKIINQNNKISSIINIQSCIFNSGQRIT